MEFFIKNLSKGALCLNEKGRIVFTNDKLLDIFSSSIKFTDSTTIFQLIPDLDENKWESLVNSLQQKQSLHLQLEFPSINNFPLITDASICLYNHLGRDFIYFIINHLEFKKEDGTTSIYRTKKEEDYNFNEIVSVSNNYKEVLGLAGVVAPTSSTVLLLGESGTGKELLSRAIHRLSPRNQAPFVRINCAVLSDNFLESELFGHEKGSFTGAIEQRIGKFEMANTGTIFLDEIGEMPLHLQAKLLRVIQEKEFSRLGGNDLIKTDARIIAATNRDLKKMVRKGKFREDLFYRLNVFPIENIPLRDRSEDIPVLTKFFINRFAKKFNKPDISISDSDLLKLTTYSFPGNVRELENLMERAVILTKKNILNLCFFKSEMETSKKTQNAPNRTFEEVQRSYILKVLKKTNWKVSGTNGAAEILDLNSQTLESKMKKFKIFRKDYI